MNNNNELYHHGILGMKWGIRRYQKKNGTYTKAGVKRFNKSLKEYESKKNKRNYARLKRDYDNVKQANLADKGKKMKSISKSSIDRGKKVAMKSMSTGAFALGLASAAYSCDAPSYVTRILATYGATSIAGGGALYAKSNSDANKLKAYRAQKAKSS